MIIVSGIIAVDPANHDAAVELMNTVAEATRAEDGNIDYAFWADLSQPGRFRVFEQWNDQDAIDAHFVSPHMAEFMGGLGGVGVTETAIDRYEVSDVSKLM